MSLPKCKNGFLPDGEHASEINEVYMRFGTLEEYRFREAIYEQLLFVFNKIKEYAKIIEGDFYLDDSFISEIPRPDRVVIVFAFSLSASNKNPHLYSEFFEELKEITEINPLVVLRPLIKDFPDFNENLGIYKILRPSSYPNMPHKRPFKKGIVKLEVI